MEATKMETKKLDTTNLRKVNGKYIGNVKRTESENIILSDFVKTQYAGTYADEVLNGKQSTETEIAFERIDKLNPDEIKAIDDKVADWNLWGTKEHIMEQLVKHARQNNGLLFQ